MIEKSIGQPPSQLSRLWSDLSLRAQAFRLGKDGAFDAPEDAVCDWDGF